MKKWCAILAAGVLLASALLIGCNRPKCQEVKPIDKVEHDLVHRIDDWLGGIGATKAQRQQLFPIVHRFMPKYEALRQDTRPTLIAAIREIQAPRPDAGRLRALFAELSARIRSFSRDLIGALLEANRLLTDSQRQKIVAKETKPRKPFEGSWLIDRSIDLFLWQIDATRAQKKLTVDLKEKLIRMSQPLQRELERVRVDMIRELAKPAPDRAALEAGVDRFSAVVEGFAPQAIDAYLAWHAQLRPDQIEVINGYLRRFEPCEGPAQ